MQFLSFFSEYFLILVPLSLSTYLQDRQCTLCRYSLPLGGRVRVVGHCPRATPSPHRLSRHLLQGNWTDRLRLIVLFVRISVLIKLIFTLLFCGYFM